MAFINVAEWSPDNVADWLKGLDDSILPYVQFFLNNGVNGCRLLLLSSDDLENLNVNKIGHQELILEGVDLLKHLHYNCASETLQTQALRLGCKARSLLNQLKHDENEALHSNTTLKQQERVSTATLSSVSEILVSVRSFISWLDRYPFCTQDQYLPVRKAVLKHSIELASTAQRDQFVDKPNMFIRDSCQSLAGICDRIVQDLNDSLAIQPASLEVVAIKKKGDDDLGLHIFSSYSGVHIVGGIKQASPSHRCGRIEEGDEIVQINYDTVCGWTLSKLVSTMKKHPTEILLTMKKRPRHSPVAGQMMVMKPYKIPTRKSSSRSQTSRFGSRNKQSLNAAANSTAAADDTDEEDEAYARPFKAQVKGPVYQLVPRKPKFPVRRRATISGASPTATQPPIRIEDLVPSSVARAAKNIGRSTLHDLSKQNSSLKLSSQCLTTSTSTTAHSSSSNITAKVPQEPASPKAKQVPSTNVMMTISSNLNNNNYCGQDNNCKSAINSNNSQVPYAKVMPLPASDRSCSSRGALVNKNLNNESWQSQPGETIPKQVVSSQVPLIKSQGSVYDTVERENFEGTTTTAKSAAALQGKITGPDSSTLASPAVDRSCKPALPAKPTAQNVGVVIPSHSLHHHQVMQQQQIQQKTTQQQQHNGCSPAKEGTLKRRTDLSPGPTTTSALPSQSPASVLLVDLVPGSQLPPPPLPLRTGLNAPANSKEQKASRMVSCKDLDKCDFQGWLYQRRDHKGFLVPSSRWSRRYVVLSQSLLYSFRTADEAKAECLINLPGFVVAPAPECKSKKFAFKVYNLTTAFHFASDSAADMSKWISKIGFAAISFSSAARSVDEAFYSETDESESESSALPRSRAPFVSRNPIRDLSPGSTTSTSSSSSDFRTTSTTRHELIRRNSSSSSTSRSSNANARSDGSAFGGAHRDNAASSGLAAVKQSAQQQRQQQSPQPNIAFFRSSSCLDASALIAAKARHQEQQRQQKAQESPASIQGSSGSSAGGVNRHYNGAAMSYAQLSFPPPSPAGVLDRKPPVSPKVLRPRAAVESSPSYLTSSCDHTLGSGQQALNTMAFRVQTPDKLEAAGNDHPNHVWKATPRGLEEEQRPPSSSQNSVVSSCSSGGTLRREPPKPQPRGSKISKERSPQPTASSSPDILRTGSSATAKPALPPKTPTTCCIVGDIKKQLDGTTNGALNCADGSLNGSEQTECPPPPPSPLAHDQSFSPVFDHVVPKEHRARLGIAVDTSIFEEPSSVKCASPESGYLSQSMSTLLDKEYERVFGGKKSLEENMRCIIPANASHASNELKNSYGDYKPPRSSESDACTSAREMHAKNTHRLNRTHSPTSDNSLSSSSGISSYYSAYMDLPVPVHGQQQVILKPVVPPKGGHVRQPSDPIVTSSPGPVKLPQKSNSFRLFNSPKLLKKFSTPKYQKERSRAEKSGKTPDDVKKPTSFFMSSPKLARAFFGFKREAQNSSSNGGSVDMTTQSGQVEPQDDGPGPYQSTTSSQKLKQQQFSGSSLNRTSSESSFTSDSPYHSGTATTATGALRKAPHLTLGSLTYREPTDVSSTDLPLTPDTPRKPTMGVTMIKKKRASNVSSDTGSIATALQQFNAASGASPANTSTTSASSSKSSATGTPDTEDEWMGIVKTLEQVGLSIDAASGNLRGSGTKVLISPMEVLDNEDLCSFVLHLRSLSRTLKVDKHQSEIEAIDELLREPISLDKLQKWLKKYPHILTI